MKSFLKENQFLCKAVKSLTPQNILKALFLVSSFIFMFAVTRIFRKNSLKKEADTKITDFTKMLIDLSKIFPKKNTDGSMTPIMKKNIRASFIVAYEKKEDWHKTPIYSKSVCEFKVVNKVLICIIKKNYIINEKNEDAQTVSILDKSTRNTFNLTIISAIFLKDKKLYRIIYRKKNRLCCDHMKIGETLEIAEDLERTRRIFSRNKKNNANYVHQKPKIGILKNSMGR